MILSQNINGVRYELLDVSSINDAADVVAQAFTNHEPMAVAQKMAARDFTAFLQSLGPVLIEEGLTVVGRDAKTHEIIGAMVTRDFP